MEIKWLNECQGTLQLASFDRILSKIANWRITSPKKVIEVVGTKETLVVRSSKLVEQMLHQLYRKLQLWERGAQGGDQKFSTSGF